jgi:NADH dehydrogenase
MILVAGGTGMLGRSLIPLLVSHGEPVRVLTRGGRQTPQLTVPGIETMIGDVRKPDTLQRAMVGVRTVISAINGFGGDGALGVTAIDRDGNVNLIEAAEAAGVEQFILVSIQQAAADHPIELFRMKAAAEQRLRASRLAWTMVRPTAYQETWLEIVGRPLVTTGSTRVFGRGQNPINFVSAGDVARIVDIAVTDAALRGESVDVQGPENLTFDAFVETVKATTGALGTVNHVPLPMLRLMSLILRPIKPVLAGQMAAAVVMDTRDMTADTTERARRFPQVPSTPLRDAAARQLRPTTDVSPDRPPLTQP